MESPVSPALLVSRNGHELAAFLNDREFEEFIAYRAGPHLLKPDFNIGEPCECAACNLRSRIFEYTHMQSTLVDATEHVSSAIIQDRADAGLLRGRYV